MDIADAMAGVIAEPTRIKYGVVTGTSGSSVIVTVEGVTMTLRRLASYTSPTNGHVVMILARDGRWTVLGNLA